MNNMEPNDSFPFNKNTLVVLTAKCEEGQRILKRSGSHWVAKPLPKQLQDDHLKDVFRGWLYLRSMLTQHRFVHVLNDRLFDVAFQTQDSVTVEKTGVQKPQQLKGTANV